MILNEPDKTATIVHDVHANFYPPALVQLLVTEFETFSQDKKLDFLMLHHHHASEPSGKQPFISAGTLSSGYFLGGFLPLIPYFCVKPRRVMLALWCSIAVVAVALFAFGWTKTCSVVGWRGNQKRGAIGALQMVGLGVVATGMAVGIVKGINHGGGAGF